MDYPFNPTSRQEWARHPGIRNAFRMMMHEELGTDPQIRYLLVGLREAITGRKAA